MTTTTAEHPTTFERFRSRVQAEFLAAAPSQVRRLRWTAEQVQEAQAAGLRQLLAHAVENSPFHRRRLAGVDLAAARPSDLTALPVMTKDDLMDDLDAVWTDRRLTRALVEEALATTSTQVVPILDEYVALASGGSSGRRGVFVYDVAALAAYMGSLSRGLLARLDAMGGPPPGGLVITMLGAASAVHATGMAESVSSGGAMPFRFRSVPATLPLDEIVRRLDVEPPVALFGYPSVLALVAREVLAGRLHVAPIAVTSTSETLLDETRRLVTSAFGVPVSDTYGTTEGLVGSTVPGEAVFAFNSDMCIVELVDQDNQPVPPGTPSAKVLVTNLSNLTQPLIRYELGDSFEQAPFVADHGHLRARVAGRSDDVLRYGTVYVHPVAVRSALLRFPAVLDYQVRQTPSGVDVDVVGDAERELGEIDQALRAALASAGLTEPHVQVQRVESLERHAETGKCRRFLPIGAVPAANSGAVITHS